MLSSGTVMNILIVYQPMGAIYRPTRRLVMTKFLRRLLALNAPLLREFCLLDEPGHRSST